MVFLVKNLGIAYSNKNFKHWKRITFDSVDVPKNISTLSKNINLDIVIIIFNYIYSI